MPPSHAHQGSTENGRVQEGSLIEPLAYSSAEIMQLETGHAAHKYVRVVEQTILPGRSFRRGSNHTNVNTILTAITPSLWFATLQKAQSEQSLINIFAAIELERAKDMGPRGSGIH